MFFAVSNLLIPSGFLFTLGTFALIFFVTFLMDVKGKRRVREVGTSSSSYSEMTPLTGRRPVGAPSSVEEQGRKPVSYCLIDGRMIDDA